MKTLKILSYLLLSFVGLTAMIACSSEEEGDDTNGGSVNNSLHLKFKTPDWERTINCEHLDLMPMNPAEGVYAVSATSASTNETFYFSYPQDSSDMNQVSNYKKYGIVGYGDNDQPFQFSQKLPDNQGSNDRLISLADNSTTYYNEVEKIEYAGHEANYSIFKVKCKYNMRTYLLSNEATIKDVSGTFHFKIRTTRN
ncbi:MAG: hypothetical protein EOO46_04415 [Flavobacterium sp.]|nr:MAG: hypothetical protein EOO46_04415 [Flavobacterium sp.]